MMEHVKNLAIRVRRDEAKKHAEAAKSAHAEKRPVHAKAHEKEDDHHDAGPARVVAVKRTTKEEGSPVDVHGAHSTVATPVIPIAEERAEPMVPARLAIPKKPVLVEGIPMHAFSIAYFCMEMGLESDVPTYAGGLGILAGDMMKSCADLDVPVIGMSLLYRKGYFTQRIDESGWQFEDDDFWDPRQHMIPLPKEVTLELEGRTVHVRAWMYKLVGARGKQNPIIFLDTDVPGNSDEDRAITARLYSGDARDRLRQEAVLGIAGLRMLLALGATNVQKFHMNEGHSALLTIELYREYASCADPAEEVRQRTAFTTHTPVAAGHDAFDEDLVLRELGVHFVPAAIYPTVMKDGRLHMTELALQFSGFVNGVAKRHGEITRELFPGYHIESITNGVYANGWVGDAHTRLFDRYLPGWRTDPYNLRYALSIPLGELWDTHMEEKRGLVSYVNDVHHAGFDERIFTIGFARRATEYKRGNMLFGDISRLNAIAEKFGGLQIVYAGKAHPRDENGKHLIQGIIGSMHHLSPKVRAVYLPDYDMKMAKRLVSGVDLWLNTPARPMEASGTSGMKAALNGVPQFSVLDGWWLEGHIEGVTGYSIGAHPEEGDRGDAFREDMEDMYTKLEYVILPRFSGEHDRWVKMMRQAIAINGSFFNTHRMVEQYVLGAYFK